MADLFAIAAAILIPTVSVAEHGPARHDDRAFLHETERKIKDRMSILVDKNTRVLCQGLGKAGTFHAMQCREYGTQMVGGVAPGKGGTVKEGFPLFNTVAEAVRKTGANATMIFVPPPAAADAIMEAADAGIARHRRHHRGHPRPRHGPGHALPQGQADAG